MARSELSVLRKDWVERQIEEVARALARLVQLEREKKYVEAEAVVADAVRALSGLELSTVLVLDADSLAQALPTGFASLRALAQLVEKDADLRRKARLEGVETRALQALALYRIAQTRGDASSQTEEAVSRLVARMDLAKPAESE